MTAAWNPAETIADTDYTDDLTILTNRHAQAESQLLNLEEAAGGIGFYVNANKSVYVF